MLLSDTLTGRQALALSQVYQLPANQSLLFSFCFSRPALNQ